MFFVKFCGNVCRKLLEVSKPASIGTTAEDAERSVVDQLSNLFIRSSPPSAPTHVPPPVTDYMPNQFGSYSGSSYTSSRYAHNFWLKIKILEIKIAELKLSKRAPRELSQPKYQRAFQDRWNWNCEHIFHISAPVTHQALEAKQSPKYGH